MTVTNSSFSDKCYALLVQVPAGKVTTYMEIARVLNTSACRAVGTAMAKNNHLVTIPCHRVVRSDGSIGQYALGADRKTELLIEEGIPVKNGKIVDLRKFVHMFST
jgi:methylated-DNA-[protein]-cysteine S-methyltransferase